MSVVVVGVVARDAKRGAHSVLGTGRSLAARCPLSSSSHSSLLHPALCILPALSKQQASPPPAPIKLPVRRPIVRRNIRGWTNLYPPIGFAIGASGRCSCHFICAVRPFPLCDGAGLVVMVVVVVFCCCWGAARCASAHGLGRAGTQHPNAILIARRRNVFAQ